MPTGAFDPNGIWLYGEDDERDTFSALLNIGQDSVSDAIGADRGRLDSLEALQAFSGVIAGPCVAATGWSIPTTNRGSKKNGLAFVECEVVRTGAAIGVTTTTGLIAANVVATFAAGWVPRTGMVFSASSYEGRVGNWRVSAGAVQLRAVTGSASIATGEALAFTAIYPLA